MGVNGIALRSSDDGETWQPLLTTSSQSLNAIATGGIAARVWFGGGAGSTVFSSTSGQ